VGGGMPLSGITGTVNTYLCGTRLMLVFLSEVISGVTLNYL